MILFIYFFTNKGGLGWVKKSLFMFFSNSESKHDAQIVRNNLPDERAKTQGKSLNFNRQEKTAFVGKPDIFILTAEERPKTHLLCVLSCYKNTYKVKHHFLHN